MWKLQMKPACDNAGTGTSRIVAPQCYSNRAKVSIIIKYHELSNETDELSLCEDCAINVTKDAEKHGYTVTRKPL